MAYCNYCTPGLLCPYHGEKSVNEEIAALKKKIRQLEEKLKKKGRT